MSSPMCHRIAHRILRALPDGARLRLNTKFAAYSGYLDPELLQLDRFIPQHRRGVALDIGANEGVTANFLATRFAAVHAFEPNPVPFALWAKVSRPNVVPWNCALSDSDGTGQLKIPVVRGQQLSGWGALDNPYLDSDTEPFTIEVQTARLQTIASKIPRPIDLIKLDAEGHELAVLRGAIEIIRADRPYLLIELSSKNEAELHELLGVHAYELATPERLGITAIASYNRVFIPRM